MTWNNATEAEEGAFTSWCDTECSKCAVGREVGESGTPHLQGTICLKAKVRFATLKRRWPSVHWEPTRDWRAAVEYCRKDGNMARDTAEKPVKDPLEGKETFEWQDEILKIIENEPDDRTIYWYWEAEGCAGKTSLAKHICLKNKDAVYLSGKAADCKYAIQQAKVKPRICLFGFVRSQESFVSFEAIEAVKDGIFFSGKYEGGMVMYDSPHVICFANFLPDVTKLSADRWVIREIEKYGVGDVYSDG